MFIRNLVGLALLVAAAVFYASPAGATCTVPNQLTNGQVADANAVMGNFNALASCAGSGVDQASWTDYTPTVTAWSGTFGSVSATGRFKQIGKTVFMEADVNIINAGTATSNIMVSLPVAPAAHNYVGTSYEWWNTGKGGTAVILPAASTGACIVNDATHSGYITTGNRVMISIVYEAP